jgi:hypothetical protein
MSTLLFLTLIFLDTVKAETPQIFTFEQHEPIEFTVQYEEPDGFTLFMIDWQIINISQGPRARGREYDNGNTFAIWAAPGEYEVQMLLIFKMGDEGRKEKKYYNLTVLGARPPPPEFKVTKAVVIADSPVSPHVPAARSEIGSIELRITDSTPKTGTGTVPLDLKPALDAASGVGYSRILVLLNDNTVLKIMPLPETTEALVEAITK